MCATCFDLYFGHLQVSQHTNIYGKIQRRSKGPLLVNLSYCVCSCVHMPEDGLGTGRNM